MAVGQPPNAELANLNVIPPGLGADGAAPAGAAPADPADILEKEVKFYKNAANSAASVFGAGSAHHKSALAVYKQVEQKMDALKSPETRLRHFLDKMSSLSGRILSSESDLKEQRTALEVGFVKFEQSEARHSDLLSEKHALEIQIAQTKQTISVPSPDLSNPQALASLFENMARTLSSIDAMTASAMPQSAVGSSFVDSASSAVAHLQSLATLCATAAPPPPPQGQSIPQTVVGGYAAFGPGVHEIEVDEEGDDFGPEEADAFAALDAAGLGDEGVMSGKGKGGAVFDKIKQRFGARASPFDMPGSVEQTSADHLGKS